ncbi:MAG TPA: polymer-forming cytoskeletal protein [Halanaerobiales bacterium]|nr:polymer-forming cytoskeletal protein [Halanaerobiales bacterium]
MRRKEKKKEEEKGKVETILGEGTLIEGDIYTKGSLRIEGKVTGKIRAEGDVFIGEKGETETEIEARNVVLAGKVNGDITSLQKIEILPKGKLKGDIRAKVLKIDEGAFFNGASTPLKNKEVKLDVSKKLAENSSKEQSLGKENKINQ